MSSDGLLPLEVRDATFRISAFDSKICLVVFAAHANSAVRIDRQITLRDMMNCNCLREEGVAGDEIFAFDFGVCHY